MNCATESATEPYDVLDNIAMQKQAQLARGKNPTHVMLNKSTLDTLTKTSALGQLPKVTTSICGMTVIVDPKMADGTARVYNEFK